MQASGPFLWPAFHLFSSFGTIISVSTAKELEPVQHSMCVSVTCPRCMPCLFPMCRPLQSY